MTGQRIGFGSILGFLVLFALHQDFWWWHDSSRVFGLPVGLTFHVVYCLLVSVFLALVVRLEDSPSESGDETGR